MDNVAIRFPTGSISFIVTSNDIEVSDIGRVIRDLSWWRRQLRAYRH